MNHAPDLGSSPHRFTIPAQLSRVAEVREWVVAVGRSASLSESRVFDLQVVTSEAAANAIEHAKSAVDLEAWVLPDRLVIEISNDGAFRPGLHKEDQGRRRGLGLPLMVSLADHVHVSRLSGERTKVTLTFFKDSRTSEPHSIPQAPAAPARSPMRRTGAAESRPLLFRGSLLVLLLPVPLLLLAVGILAGLHVQGIRESPTLLTALNTLLVVGPSLVVALLAARTYLAGGSRAQLTLGAGSLFLGLGHLLAGPMISDPDEAATVQNTTFLLAGVLFAVTGFLILRARTSAESSPVRSRLALVYGGVVAFVVLWSLLASQELLPAYLAPQMGYTATRSVVLGLGVAGFVVAFVCFALVYRKRPSGFVILTGACYAMFAAAIGSGLVTSALLGSPITWVVRAGTWLGGVYLLVGALTAQYGGAWLLPLERSLRALEDRYQGLVDLSPDAVLVHTEGRFISANWAAARLLGYPSPAEIVGKGVHELLHPSTRQAQEARIGEVYAGAISPSAEERFMRVDGSPVDVVVFRTRVELGGRLAVQTVARDITERNKAEEALRESERKYRTLFENAYEGVVVYRYVLDDRGEVTDLVFEGVNLAAEAAIGMGRTELMGRKFTDVFGRGLLDRYLPYARKMRRTNSPVAYEDPEYYVERLRRYFTSTYVPLDQDRFIASTRDVTTRKQAQEARQSLVRDLAAERQELQTVLETMADGLIIADGEANILHMNPEALRIHGFANVDQVRRNLHSWPELEPYRLDGSVLPPEESALARVTRGESFRDYEYEVRNKETGAAWIGNFSATPIRDESGEVVLAVLTVRDVTEHRQAEEALRRSEERYRALAEENERLYRQQLDIAESLQTALLSIPSEMGSVRLGHLYRSATEAARVGGDFYDAFEVKDGKIAILVGDVAGHGIEAARTATLVKDVVHAFTHQSLRSHKVLSRANAVLMEKELPGFVTLFLAILDTETGLLRYANAGHPQTMLRRASGDIERLGEGSSPLGIRAEATWKPGEVRLEAGDMLLLYTDGIVEARRDREFFGDERLEKLLKRKRLSVDRLPGLIVDQVLAFSDGKLTDDIAVLAVALTQGPEEDTGA